MPHHLPKAELHVHLDGTLTPELIRQLAHKHEVTVDSSIFTNCGQFFYWQDFAGFHRVFEEAFQVIRDVEDVQLITYNYLQQLAGHNTCYAELIVSPYHAANSAIEYATLLKGLQAGIDQARQDYGIEARVLMVFMRHYGPDKANDMMQTIIDHPHPYVVGVNLVGDIQQYAVAEFKDCFKRAQQHGLGLSCHAGELGGGVEEIWQAIDDLQVDRVSHGVRCLEDPELVKRLVEEQIHLEVCPTSNIVLGMYPDYEAHPFKQLHQAGLNLGLNTDDPGFFDTNITREYQIAQDYYGLTDDELKTVTLNALQASFVDDKLKQSLQARVGRK